MKFCPLNSSEWKLTSPDLVGNGHLVPWGCTFLHGLHCTFASCCLCQKGWLVTHTEQAFLSSNNMPELSTAWINLKLDLQQQRIYLSWCFSLSLGRKLNLHLNQGHKWPSRDLYSHLLEQWQNNESFLHNLVFPSELLLRTKWEEYQRSCWRSANKKTAQWNWTCLRVRMCCSWATIGWCLGWYSKPASALQIRDYKAFYVFSPPNFLLKNPTRRNLSRTEFSWILYLSIATSNHRGWTSLLLSPLPSWICSGAFRTNAEAVEIRNPHHCTYLLFILPFMRAMKC